MFAGSDQHAPRRALSVVVATALLVAGCSSSDNGSTSGSNTAPVSAAPASGEPADVPAPEPTAPATEPVPATTAPTPEVTPLAARRSTIPARAPNSAVELVNDLAVVAASEASPGVAILAGSTRPDPGVPYGATVHLVRADGLSYRTTTVTLDDADATESAAYGAGADGDRVVVVGTVLDASGTPQPAIWQSRDRGETFGPVETIADGAATAFGVAFVSQQAIVAARVPTSLGSDIVVYRETADGWEMEAVTTGAVGPFVNGMVASGTTVLLAGGEEVEGVSRARIWHSTDARTGFEPIMTGLETYTEIGAPVIGLDGFVATAAGIGAAPTDLVTSTDGRAWRPIPLTLTGADGSPVPVPEAGAGRVVVDGGGFAIGIEDIFGEVARVAVDGTGIATPAPRRDNERYGATRPFVLDGQLLAVGSAQRSFRLTVHDGDNVWTDVGDPRRPIGAVPVSTRLELVGDGVAALAIAFPSVRQEFGNNSFGPIEQWGIQRDGRWQFATRNDIPSQAVALDSDGTRQVAIRFDDDPEDARSGPIEGSRVLTRTDGGGWVEGELILTGPGGDYLVDIAHNADGFVAVGRRAERTPSGNSVTTPAIVNEIDGTWTEQATPPIEGEQVWLDRVVATDGGLLVATGGRTLAGTTDPVVVIKPSGGSWAVAALPTEAADIVIRDVGADDTGVTIITEEDRSWWRHRTTDGVTFVRTPIQIEDPARSRIVRAIIAADRTLLVGSVSALGALQPAVWELDSSGSVVRLPIDGVRPSLERRVEDAELLDDVLYVSGVDLGENVVWEIDLAS